MDMIKDIIQELLNNFEIDEKELYTCVPLHEPFEKQTISQLKEVCKERSIRLKSTMKKGDIIRALNDADMSLFCKSVLDTFTLTQEDIDECKSTIKVNQPLHETKPVEDLSGFSVATLKNLCKQRNLAVSGNKTDLIERLNGGNAPIKKQHKKNTKACFGHFQRPTLCIRRNIHGRYEQEETGFVFDPITQLVIGKENDGVCQPLNTLDIELCKQKKLSWKVPLNLDIN